MRIDLTNYRILLVAVANNEIGYGHLSRCLALAAHAIQQHGSVIFLLFGTEEAKKRVVASGFECFLFEESAIDNIEAIEVSGISADIVIADLLFPTFFLACHQPEALFLALRSLGRYLITIDSLGEQSIRQYLQNISENIIISPYASSVNEALPEQKNFLTGAQYALLASEYANLPPRHQRFNANRILISCGGSDPRGFTSEILRGLEAISQKLEIRAVIGPMFSADLIMELKLLRRSSRHTITLVLNASSLLNEMLWCDLAIGANGLTKYELAASETPALLFSIDAHHDLANRSFAALQTSIDLGIGISAKKLAGEVSRLLGDVDLRALMAARGRLLIDGLGVQRLFTKVIKELSCQQMS
jgi:spore coat polysaccharide biosynthesis predicted glycosyltransferase SpsG